MRTDPDLLRRSRIKEMIMAAALTVVAGSGSLCQAQTQTTLRQIEIVGLQRLSADQVIQTSGLKVGDSVDANIIDAAAGKLMDSGKFRKVSYRVRIADNQSTVTFEVEESPARGPAITDVLGQVQWTGNSALSSQELSAAFGMNPGDLADRAKIDKGIEAVRKAYARKGYVAAQISESSTRDDSNRRMNYQFTINEGHQYRMGSLIVAGLTTAETQSLKSKWMLAAGAIFDDSYLDGFRETVLRPLVATLTRRSRVRAKYEVARKPDMQKQTVDVVIAFK